MLDRTGFKRQRFEDLLSDMEDKARDAWGETINTSAASPLGIILRIFAWFLAAVWATAEDVYNAGYVNTAEGNNLDRLGPNAGITRDTEQYATGYVTFSGTPGYLVPAETQVRTETDVYFETAVDAQVGTAGTVTVEVDALDPGLSGNVAAGAIVIIVNPTAELTAVTNAAAVTGGRAKETDDEFRTRYTQSVAGGGGGTSDSVLGAVLSVSGVRAATVINNRTSQSDADGRPPNSYQVYALGGADQEIAEAIFARAPGGIEMYGDVHRVVADLSGELQDVYFSRAAEVLISVVVNVTKNASYPADGDALIRSAIVRYIGGEYDGAYYNGLTMGADVVYTRLISAVYSVDGVEDVAVTAGTGGAQAAQNVGVARYQVAQTSEALIEVTSHV